MPYINMPLKSRQAVGNGLKKTKAWDNTIKPEMGQIDGKKG